ncbi:MAG: winged helix-turn-helix domain-containing protein, partial [Campylobacterales bacterium]|nr:winged helix-turn-helix domain-containing protein [Campylobacterales bacterium]
NINGLELLNYILNYNSTAKVIIMSADTSIDTISQAYRLGSIDFIKKPFEIKELQLKILAMNHRQHKLLDSIEYKESINKLTHKEKELLKLLLENKNEIITLKDIENTVYSNDDNMSTDALRSLMKRLRSKLKDDIIKTLPYQGYMLIDI